MASRRETVRADNVSKLRERGDRAGDTGEREGDPGGPDSLKRLSGES